MAQQMDAVASFVYLTENVPKWLDLLATVTKHAAEKNAEFVAEYARVVSRIRPKSIKSPSLQSIHSEKGKSVHLSQIDPQNEASLPTPPNFINIDPLESGTKYLYARAQKKRKPDESIRSGASGPQKFRSKHQVIIYYDSFIQCELDTMFKALSAARNNLRKGRNALVASRGFQLPAVSRRRNPPSLNPSLENIRDQAISLGSPVLPTKYSLRSSSQKPADRDEACITEVDQMLEAVQGLLETAAHQFLRDGDCKKELDTGRDQLNIVLNKARTAAERLQEKAKKEEETRMKDEADAKDVDSDTTLYSKPSTKHFGPFPNKLAPPSVSKSFGELNSRRTFDVPPIPPMVDASLPTAETTIEVDDDASEDGSLVDLDISQFRVKGGRGLRI
jgi:hypothetical protein